MNASTAPMPQGARRFLLISAGQIVSALGSGLTAFAVGLWFYAQTGSVTRFSLIFLSSMLPRILSAPFSGYFVDRWSRRLAMLMGDSGCALGTLALLLLLRSGAFHLWSVSVVIVLKSAFEVPRDLAFNASIAQLLPKAQYGRANGVVQAIQAASQTFSPLLAAALLSSFGLWLLLFLDLVSFVPALLALCVVKIPAAGAPVDGGAPGFSWQRMLSGWKYVRETPGLLRLLIFSSLSNFYLGFPLVLSTPLIMSFGSIRTVGVVTTVANAGFLLGSIVVSLWGGPRKRVLGILIFALVEGASLMVAGLRPSTFLVTIGAFGVFFVSPLITTCSQVIWQTKTPAFMQGRVFSVRMALGLSSAPLAYILAGPLVDNFFTRLLLPGTFMGNTVGLLLGTGPGRGIGLFFVITGAMACMISTLTLCSGPLWHIERELPDPVDVERTTAGLTAGLGVRDADMVQ